MVYLNWSVNDCVDQAALFEEEELDQYEIEENKAEYTLLYKEDWDKDNAFLGEWISDLIVFVGSAATSFANMYIDLTAYDEIGEIVPKLQSDEKPKKKNKQTCSIHKKGHVVTCLMNYHVEAKDCISWISTLMDEVSAKRVFVISSFPKSHFVGNDEVKNSDSDFLRYLKNTECEQKTEVTQLERGNLIGNLPAAIMNYCSANKCSCMLYISYTESHFVDVFTFKCLIPVLRDLDLKQITYILLREKLKNFDGCGVADNNVYI